MTKAQLIGIKINRHRVIIYITHMICLAILFLLPEVVMNLSEPRQEHIPPGVFVKTIIYISTFYINYFFIIDHCLNKSYAFLRLAGYNIILISLSLIIIHLSWKFSAGNMPIQPHPHETTTATLTNETTQFARALSLLLRDLIILILTISLGVATKFANRIRNEKRQQQEILTMQREEELKGLKNQLNPHFLFNSLNCIYSLIIINQAKAQKAVHELSQLLRYVIYDDTEEVTLQQEVDFINNYIKLMKLRIGDKHPIIFTHNITDYANISIAPLLFITIVENAFKYGNTGNPTHKIEIAITAKDNIIQCHTFNHFIPNLNKPNSTGIGIPNLKQRLNLLYGNNASLKIAEDNLTRTYTANLTIKISNNHQNEYNKMLRN